MTRRNTAAKITAGAPPRPLAPNNVEPNSFMGRESAIHNDTYSSDVSDAVAPLGIYPEVGCCANAEGLAPAAVFFDDQDCAVIPYKTGCVGVADLDGESIRVLGGFEPDLDDAGGYGLQFAYSFIDSLGRLVGPTTHGHVVILRTRDENKMLLERFEKVLDVDILAASVSASVCSADEIQRLTLLSTVFDYEGNLWFTTGYYRLYPDKAPAGFFGYISREYLDAAMPGKSAGKSADLPEKIYFHKLEPGEGAENGISACQHGTVILTNRACYLLKASEGVTTEWRMEYESCGARDAEAADAPITGGGLAWGAGTTPTLTKELALFTDNAVPNMLQAISLQNGELVASTPVLDKLPKGVRVSVENSILVYSGDESRVSVVVCNWFGAGNPKLKDLTYPAKVSYDDLYDQNWVNNGNNYLYPGVERVDIVKNNDDDYYCVEKQWLRSDLRGTSIFKLSTASGHLYCYDQDLTTGMWMFRILDFGNGRTLLEIPVSDEPECNNMAVGMTIDTRGNALYCPSNSPNLLRLRDRFVYLPDTPERLVDLGQTGRRRLNSEEATALRGEAVSFLHTARIEAAGADDTVAFRLNGLNGTVEGLAAFALAADGPLSRLEGGWELTGEGGAPIAGELAPDTLYELRLRAGSLPDYDPAGKSVRASVILVRQAGR